MTEVEVLDFPVKSENDKKLYRVIRLENGLKALLISAPSKKVSTAAELSTNDDKHESVNEDGDQVNEMDSKQAACAVCVGVGTLSDPPDVQGMAHFLEHLIFMGSEKYPKENDFEEYMEKLGSTYNANTESNETTFYFQVREQFLSGAMDRFSNLLKAPLLLKDSMMREREAVDSEFSAEKINDSIRRRQILSSLCQTGHPYAKFGCGNLKSLKDDIDDDVLHKEVIDFKTRHYSAHRMYVCVQSQQPLDHLQDMVVQHFSDMPNNHMDGDDFSAFNHQNSFQSKFYEKIYFIKPIRSSLRIDITWCMEPIQPNYKFKPESYVSNILGHEGKGSLLSYLRKKLWADELTAGTTVSEPNLFSFFIININLTEDGFKHLDEVLEAVFGYLKLLQVAGPNETLFHELQSIRANRFRFAQEANAFYNVQGIVGDLIQYPAKDILTGPKLLFEYNSDLIRKLIDELNSRKFNIMITSTRPYNDQVTFESTDPWYGTKYTELDMPAKWIDIWENAKPLPELTLPEPNPFIADDFTIFHEAGSTVPKYPTKILENDLCELWYRQDDKFLLPTAYYKFQFVSPYFNASTKNSAITSLLARIIRYKFVEELYAAKTAGLSYTCYSSDSGLLFYVSGFNQKLHLLVDIFCKHLKLLADESTENQFNMAIQQELKDNENKLFYPSYLSSYLGININQYHFQPFHEKNKCLHSLTFADFQEFCRNFGEEMRLKALIQGNVTETTALSVVNKMLNELDFKKIEIPSSVQLKALKLPVGSNYLRCKNFNAQDINSSILNVYQIGPFSYETHVLLSLLEMVAKEPCFHNLRTLEQLAYIVSFRMYHTHNVLGYKITVNSQETKFRAEYVDERIENFRHILITIIENISEDDFNTTKISLARKKLVEFNELSEEVQRNWDEIYSNYHEFDRKIKEVECLSKITKEQLLEFYRAHYGQNERKLSIQVIGNSNANADKNEPEGANEIDVEMKQSNNRFDELLYVGFDGESKGHLIDDYMAFKNSLDVYPVEGDSVIVSNEK